MSNAGLGFLYQTRTILQPLPRLKNTITRSAFSTSASRCERLRPQRQSRVLDRATQADTLPGYDSTSTLTPHEDQKFRAIFEAAAKGLPPPSLQRDAQAKEKKYEETYQVGNTLDQHFEASKDGPAKAAVRPRSPAIARFRELPPDFPLALQNAWRDVRRAMPVAIQRPKRHEPQKHALSQEEQELEEQKAANISTLLQRFEQAQSDHEIWRRLQNEVFPRVLQLVRVVRQKSKTLQSQDTAGTGLRKRKTKKKTEKSEENDDAPVMTPTNATIIQATYSVHILNALRVLRAKFPRSPYALALLPAVRSIDPVSQVLGLSTEAYNELLFILWRQHSDILECARTVEEMNSQGITADGDTNAVFVDAEREQEAARNPDEQGLNGVRRAWWQLKAVQDAMKRWSAAMDVLDARTEEERRYQEDWQDDAGEIDAEDEEEGFYSREIIAEAATAPP